MKRTQIYLPEDLYNELRLETQSTKLSVSELIRQAVSEKLTKKMDARGGVKTLARIAAIGATGPKDLAQNLEHYLYGKKRQ